MSRIGKKPITILDGAEVKIEGNKVFVKGPKGELIFILPPGIKAEISQEDSKILKVILGNASAPNAKKAWGTSRALIANMIEGVVKGFERKLEIEGVGFKAIVEADNLVLNIGYSHPVKLKIPAGIKAAVEKNIIIISGIDKNTVGQFAANIRAEKKPEPYKGKGIRYQGEIIRRKLGKKAVGAGGK